MKGIAVLRKAAPTILSCLGSAGLVATTVLAVQATPTAIKLLKQDGICTKEDMKTRPKDVIRVCWKPYLATVLVGSASIVCIFGANILNQKSQASLASAYALANESYKRYRAAASKVYGEDADRKIKAQVAKDANVTCDGMSIYSADLDPNEDLILCYDMFSNRYFKSTIASVMNAEYHLNRNLVLRGDASINEFYEFLGIDHIDGGDEIGWSMSELVDNGLMWLDFENARSAIDGGLMCCVVSPIWDPTDGYLEYENG